MGSINKLLYILILVLVLSSAGVVVYGLFFMGTIDTQTSNPSPITILPTATVTPDVFSPSIETMANEPLKRTLDSLTNDYYIQQVVTILDVLDPTTFIVQTIDGIQATVTVTPETTTLRPNTPGISTEGVPQIELYPDSQGIQTLVPNDLVSIGYWENDWSESNKVPLLELIILK